MIAVMALPLSAVLITRDASRHLDTVLAPLACCDEILILDSGSTDDTPAIAKAHGATIHTQAFLGFGPQKRKAIALARHDWVLCLDGDEVLDEDAVAALQAIDWAAADPKTAWRLDRLNYVGHRPIRHGSWMPDRPIRLFHRAHFNFNENPIHEYVPASGPTRLLPGTLHHHSYADLADIFRLDYHRRKAARYRERGRRASAPVLALRAWWGFIRSYLLRAGFLDGRAGVIVALSVALNDCLGLALASEERE